MMKPAAKRWFSQLPAPVLKAMKAARPRSDKHCYRASSVWVFRFMTAPTPDVWIVAFKEGAGNVNMAASEEALKLRCVGKIIETSVSHSLPTPKISKMPAISLSKKVRRRTQTAIPGKKTDQTFNCRHLFNERGAPKFESGKLSSQYRQEGIHQPCQRHWCEDKSLKGVFVRRNVPFIIAAVSTDNGNRACFSARSRSQNRRCKLTKEVERDGDAYLFRVPNYPRSEYKDQPDYYFTTQAGRQGWQSDHYQNAPLYIVNTQAAFEGGRNQ
jgi:hypothetical protein